MINKNILLIGGSGNLGQKILSSQLFDKIFAPKKTLNLLKPSQIDNFLKKYD